MNGSKPHSRPRNSPRQSRSKATVKAIVTAAAHVLVETGYDGTTTNRVAKVAGVSIGSLYQYFANKEALVVAVVEQHCTRMVELLAQSVTALGSAPIPVAIASYIDAMIRAHGVDQALHRVVVQQVMHLGFEQVQAFQMQSRQIVAAFLETRRDEVLPKDLDLAAYVLVTAVEGVVHNALAIDEPFDETALKGEVAALVLGYLLGRPDAHRVVESPPS